MIGMTLKQFARRRFFLALEDYKKALASGESQQIVRASLAVHIAKAEVPKSLYRFASAAFRESRA
jgi:hypothetical protein